MDCENRTVASYVQFFEELKKIYCCFFHLTQSVYKKMCGLKLRSKYGEHPDFSTNVRMLSALAFVPVELVPEFYNDLVKHKSFSREAKEIAEYFFKTYVSENTLFMPQLCNMYAHTLDGQDRTNKCLEGWHNALHSTFISKSK